MIVNSKYHFRNDQSCWVNQLVPFADPISVGHIGRDGISYTLEDHVEILNYGQIVHMKSLRYDEVFPFEDAGGDRVLSVQLLGGYSKCYFDPHYNVSHFYSIAKADDAGYGIKDAISSIGTPLSPVQLTSYASDGGYRAILFAYGDPIVNLQYIEDVSDEARKANLELLISTEGYGSLQSAKIVIDRVDGVEVRLHSLETKFYRKFCKIELKPILKFIEQLDIEASPLKQISYSHVPGENDSESTLNELFTYVSRLKSQPTLLIQPFYPRYKVLDKPPSTKAELDRILKIAADFKLKAKVC